MDGPVVEVTLEEMQKLAALGSSNVRVNVEWNDESLNQFFGMTYQLLEMTQGAMKGLNILLQRIKALEAGNIEHAAAMKAMLETFGETKDLVIQLATKEVKVAEYFKAVEQRHDQTLAELDSLISKLAEMLGTHVQAQH